MTKRKRATSSVQRVVRPRYRVVLWATTTLGASVYAVKTWNDGRWRHCCWDTHPLLYTKIKTARQIVRWLNDRIGIEPTWEKDSAVE